MILLYIDHVSASFDMRNLHGLDHKQKTQGVMYKDTTMMQFKNEVLHIKAGLVVGFI